jgi:hypothetical protein
MPRFQLALVALAEPLALLALAAALRLAGP